SAPVAAPPAQPAPPAQRAPARRLALGRGQLALAGGGLLVVVLVIAIVLGTRGGASAPPRDAAVATAVVRDAPAVDPSVAILAEIDDLVRNDERDAALERALRARRQYPDNAKLALVAGKLYFAKLYWSDGLHQLHDAIRLEPSYRSDPELIKTVLRGFITTPGTDEAIARFLTDEIGAPAAPYLEETAKEHPNPQIRSRAAALLRRFR
ncbi:MAG TPA: hypothetical protein VLX92_24035, partial [Kofleriaceae bacterium]|nr:hypothetical protein [Kofleriaceae bacterium]